MKSKNSFGHILVQDLNMLFPEDSSYIPDVNLIVNSIADQSTLDQTIYLRIGTSQREAAKLGGYSRASGNESPVCPWPKKIRCQISLCVCATIPHAFLNRIVWSDLTFVSKNNHERLQPTRMYHGFGNSLPQLGLPDGRCRRLKRRKDPWYNDGRNLALCVLKHHLRDIEGWPTVVACFKKKRSDFVLRMKVWRFCMSQYNRIDT